MKIHALLASLDPVWAIEPGFAAKALHVIETMESAGTYEFEAAQSKQATRHSKSEDDKYVAVIPITGVMCKQMTSAQWMVGGTSTVDVRRQLRNAVNDGNVTSIVLLIDSPGGTVAGLDDLASDIKDASEKKPVVAFIEDSGHSAAYYIASQASWICANRTAMLGCIGTVSTLSDWSRLYENAGVKVEVISTGGIKGHGAHGTAVTQGLREQIQASVDHYGAFFVEAVSSGRNLPEEKVREYATGHWWGAEDAKAMGLIDEICSLGDLINDLQSGRMRSSKAVTAGATQQEETMEKAEKPSLLDSLKALVGIHAEPSSAAGGDSPGATTQLATPSDDRANLAIEAAAKIRAEAEADKFIDGLSKEARITSAESEKARSTFLTMVKADGGGKFDLDAEGNLVTGEATAAYTEVMNARPRHMAIFEETITPEKIDASSMSAATKSYLKSMPEGSSAKLEEEK